MIRTRSAAFVVALTAATVTVVAAQSEKLGTGVTDRAATPIADLYAAPDKFVGQTIRVEGVVTAVCEAMGCWMALAPADEPAKTVRFKVDHDGIVFPIKARGRMATAEGVFEKIATADAEAREAAAEQLGDKKDAFGTTYQVKAKGAVIK